VKQKNRRRNRYQTRAHLTLPEPGRGDMPAYAGVGRKP
jgi:hypothetical protein